MKIVRKIPMNYTVVYVEDRGRYAAYKRFSADEWHEITRNRMVSDKDLIRKLEAAYSESDK
jgi:hypothetical protein